MRILIVGDLMGARADEAPPIDRRPILAVSVDTFDDVFARFKPSASLPALGLKAPLRFEALADFHPDQLFERVELFDRLRSLRQRLQNPSTFAAAAAELKSDAPAQPSPRGADSGAVPTTSPTRTAARSSTGFWARRPVLASAPLESTQLRAQAGVEAFIRSLVAPYVTADNEPQLRQLVSAVDAAIGDAMRSLLHDAGISAARSPLAWCSVVAGERRRD